MKVRRELSHTEQAILPARTTAFVNIARQQTEEGHDEAKHGVNRNTMQDSLVASQWKVSSVRWYRDVHHAKPHPNSGGDDRSFANFSPGPDRIRPVQGEVCTRVD